MQRAQRWHYDAFPNPLWEDNRLIAVYIFGQPHLADTDLLGPIELLTPLDSRDIVHVEVPPDYVLNRHTYRSCPVGTYIECTHPFIHRFGLSKPIPPEGIVRYVIDVGRIKKEESFDPPFSEWGRVW